MGNNARLEVKGIGTCRLALRECRILLLHDVLYAPSIRRNLISVSIMMDLDFMFFFSKNNISLSLGTVVYGFGYFLIGLIILDTEYVNSNYNTSSSFIISLRDYEN